MKCNPLRWLWGLLPIAALAYCVVRFEHEAIQDDIRVRVDAELKGTGLRWAKSGVSGRDVLISGRATDESEPQKAIDAVTKIWGVRLAENQTELVERAAAYSWWATLADRRVTLRGLVPNDATRETILSSARTTFPGVAVNDEMRLARGVPTQDVWLNGIGFGLKQLQGLKAGEARLDGLGLSVSGEAASQASYGSVKTALANGLPRGIRLTDDRVTPPVIKPYVWAARASGSQLTFTGNVPNAGVRSEVEAVVRQAYPRLRATDRTEFGDGAPPGFLGVISASLRELARLEEASATLTDTTLAVEGMATDEITATAVRRALRSALPQNYRLTEQIRFREAPPPPAAPPVPAPLAVSPYTGSAEFDSGRIVLVGYAPSDTAKAQIEQSARTRFPGRTIDNRLAIATGAPDGWQRCFDGGLLGLARLGSGRIALSDRRLDLVARTDDEDLVAAVPTDIRGNVQAACDVNARIDYAAPQEPEGRWSARRDAERVVLAGEVTSGSTRIALLAQARRQFPNTEVRDDMSVVENRSKTWPRAAEVALASLSEVDVGEAVVLRQVVNVTGEARYEPSIIERVREKLRRDLPRGYSGREQITMLRPPVQQPVQTVPRAPTPVPPQPVAQPLAPPQPITAAGVACQERLRETARTGVISFDRARALLKGESTQTLDRIAQIARTCPRVKIEIAGHTDSEGTPERNQGLSDRRAQAVRDYLTRGGVDASILTASGYGETRPMVPNDTPENRARNRRIEFNVTE